MSLWLQLLAMVAFFALGLLAGKTLGVHGRTRRAHVVPDTPKHDPQVHLSDRFSSVFDATPFAIMLVRVNDGCIVDVNAAFTELWSYSREEAIGKTSNDLSLWIEPTQLVEKLKNDRHSDVQVLQIRRKSGAHRDVTAWVRLIQLVDGGAHLLITAEDATERNRSLELEHLAHHDTLTQLPNRTLLIDRIDELQQREPAAGAFAAVLFLDLDRFKPVNDTYGHSAGDELLRLVSARLRSRLRATDLLSRLGGDEFVIVLDALRDPQEAIAIADELVRQISTPFLLSQRRQVSIGLSVGVAYILQKSDPEHLLQQADTALYEAKRAGRNSVSVFMPSQGSEIATAGETRVAAGGYR